MKPNRRNLTLLKSATCVALILSLTSCSRMGMTEKLGAVMLTAGTTGALVAQQNAAAGIAGGAAAGLIPASAALVVNETPATAEQIARVEGRGRSVINSMSPSYRNKLREQNISHLAIETTKPAGSRGESAVMIYDIDTGRVAKPTVFDVRVTPKLGSAIKFDTVITEYVGDGSDTSFLDGAPQTIDPED